MNLNEKWILVELVEVNSRAKIKVTDSGTGLSTTVLEKIMDSFFTAKELGKGAGLGLSISKGIAESHQGHLTCDSMDKNTSFMLDLPQKQSDKISVTHKAA